ncbi:TPA: family 20 glycosylhydrolase [Streptococcus suis]
MKFKKQEIFSIRKCKVCVASIVIGLGFGMASGVLAQEVGEVALTNESSLEQPIINTDTEEVEPQSDQAATENAVDTLETLGVEAVASGEIVGETRQASDTTEGTGEELPQETPLEAAPAPEAYTAEEKLSLIKAISLDGGRKYFSPDQLKAVIDTASQKGFTDFHLLLGNDGLRFLLDDMSLTVNGNTYSSEAVKQAIQNGNRAYYDDPNGNYLTQAEMDDLITYAKDRYMNLIPAINSPGHMDAILEAMKELGIENPAFTYRNKASARTVDLNNQEAVDFTKALIEKYATYFSGKTDIFNIGLDEYANDVSKTSGFRLLKLQGQYPKFIQYANDLAAIVKKHNMSPMAFNDGIYYESDDQSGTFDTDLIVSYWTGGWQGYSVASSKFLADKGHAILNTNDAWYYVIGRDNKNSGWYNLDQGLDGIGKVPLTHVQKNEDSDIPIVGSMMAIWADKPELTYRKELLDRMMNKLVEKNADFFRANYQPILREIKKAPEDLTSYPKEAVDAYKAAFEAINWELSQADTAQIQSMYARLREARIALTGPDAEEEVLPAETTLNQSALEQVLAQLDGLDKTKLTEEEKADLQTALEAVDAIVANGNQEEIDQLVEELQFMLELLTPSVAGSSETTPEPNGNEGTSNPAPVSPSTQPTSPSPSAGTGETGSTSSDEVAAADPLQALVAQLDQIDTATLSEAEREELEGLTDAVLLAVDAGVQEQIDAAIAQVQTWLAAHSPSQPSSPAPVSPSTQPTSPSPSAGTGETGSTSSDEVAVADPLQALVAQLDQIDTATLSEAEREELEGLTDAVLLAVDAGVQEQIDAAIAQVQTWLAAHSPSQPTSPAPVSPSTQPTSPSPSAGTGETGPTSSDEVAVADPLQALVAQLDQIDTATLSEAEREELEGLTDAVLLAVDAGVQEQIDAAIAQVQTWLAARSTGEGATSQPSNPAPVSPSTEPATPSPSAGTSETGSPSSAPVSQPASTVESKQEEEISSSVKPISTQPTAPNPTAGTGETGSPSSAPVSQPASTVESKQEEEISSSVKPNSTEGEQGDVQAGQTETDKALEEESVPHVNSEATEVVTKEEELITFVPAYAPQMAALPEGHLPEIVFAKGESTQAPSLPVLELPKEEEATKETVRHTSPQPASSQAPLSQSVGKKDLASAKALPQTGQSSNQEWLLLGGLVGLFGLAKLRKKEDM